MTPSNRRLVLRQVLGPSKKAYTKAELQRLLEDKAAELCRRLPYPRRRDFRYEPSLTAEGDKLFLDIYLVVDSQRALPLDELGEQSIESALSEEIRDLPERIIDEYARYLARDDDAPVDESVSRMHTMVLKGGGGEVAIRLPDQDISLLLPDPPALVRGVSSEFCGAASLVSTRSIQLAQLHEIRDGGVPIAHRAHRRYSCILERLSARDQSIARHIATCCFNGMLESLRVRAVPLLRPGTRRIAFLELESLVIDRRFRRKYELIEELVGPENGDLFEYDCDE